MLWMTPSVKSEREINDASNMKGCTGPSQWWIVYFFGLAANRDQEYDWETTFLLIPFWQKLCSAFYILGDYVLLGDNTGGGGGGGRGAWPGEDKQSPLTGHSTESGPWERMEREIYLQIQIICPPVKPLPDEHDEEEKVAEEAESYEEAVEHQDGGETRRIPLIDY